MIDNTKKIIAKLITAPMNHLLFKLYLDHNPTIGGPIIPPHKNRTCQILICLPKVSLSSPEIHGNKTTLNEVGKTPIASHPPNNNNQA
ncbi:Uncharacterised protein [Mycoplasma putrefaciens]|nr:Uncharacterised protein [Mycoplasma putrefaciens]